MNYLKDITNYNKIIINRIYEGFLRYTLHINLLLHITYKFTYGFIIACNVTHVLFA